MTKSGGVVRWPNQPTPQPKVSTTTTLAHHSGPLPPPDDLHRYDQLLPGAAQRIIVMAETEQRHRISMEQATLVSDQRHRDQVLAAQVSNAGSIFRADFVGQLCGWSIAVACVGGAIYNVYLGGSPWATAAFLGLPVATIINAVRNHRPTKRGDKSN